ncbi:hypothetical protein B0J14DRAFT_18020 [Halenospora varia]|nr:hypothetical protein B0J14DRAFT_18020 [Halenospora varia]
MSFRDTHTLPRYSRHGKEKPYKCEVCGKRYKNLNGLKYDEQHSPPCKPELKFNNVLCQVSLFHHNSTDKDSGLSCPLDESMVLARGASRICICRFSGQKQCPRHSMV